MACFDTTLYVYTSVITAGPVPGTSQTSATSSYSYFIQQSAESAGISNRDLTLGRYNTYTFILSTPWTEGVLHPLKFSTTVDGVHQNGVEDITGIEQSAGAPGEEVRLTINHRQPTTFYYFCNNHSDMGGSITIDETCNGDRLTDDDSLVEIEDITTRQPETEKVREQFTINNQLVDELILREGVKYTFFINNAAEKKFRIKDAVTGRILQQIDGINVNDVSSGVVEFAPVATGVLEVEDGPTLKVLPPPERDELGGVDLKIPDLLDAVPFAGLPACPVPREIFYIVNYINLDDFSSLSTLSAVTIANDVGATLSGNLNAVTQTLTATNLTAAITGTLDESIYVDVLSTNNPVYALSSISALSGTIVGSVTGNLGESIITETITGGTIYVPISGHIARYNSVITNQLIRGNISTYNLDSVEISGYIGNPYLSSVSSVSGELSGSLPLVEYTTDIIYGSLSGNAGGYFVDDPDSYLDGLFSLSSMTLTGGLLTGTISGETISQTLTSGTLSVPDGGSKWHYQGLTAVYVEGLISSDKLASVSVSGYVDKTAIACDLTANECLWNTTITAVGTAPWDVHSYALSTMTVTGGSLSGHIDNHIVYKEIPAGVLSATSLTVVATSVDLTGFNLAGTASALSGGLSSAIVSGTFNNTGSTFTAAVTTTASAPWNINVPTFTGTITANPAQFSVSQYENLYNLLSIPVTGGVLTGTNVSETITGGQLRSAYSLSSITVEETLSGIPLSTNTTQLLSALSVLSAIPLSGTIHTDKRMDLDVTTTATTILSNQSVTAANLTGIEFGSLSSVSLTALASDLTATTKGGFSTGVIPVTATSLTGASNGTLLSALCGAETDPPWALAYSMEDIPVAGGSLQGIVSGQSQFLTISGGNLDSLSLTSIAQTATITNHPITGIIDLETGQLSVGVSGTFTKPGSADTYSTNITGSDSVNTTLSVYALTSIPVTGGTIIGPISGESINETIGTGTLSSTTLTYILTSDSLSDHTVGGTVSGINIPTVSVTGLLATLTSTEIHTDQLTATSNVNWPVNVYPLTSIAVTGGSINQDSLIPPVTSYPYFRSNLNETLTGGILSSTTVAYILTSNSLSNHLFRGHVSSDELLTINVSGSLTTTTNTHSGSIAAEESRPWKIPTLISRPVYDAKTTNTITIVTSTAPVVSFESRNQTVARTTYPLHDVFSLSSTPISSQPTALSTVNVTLTSSGTLQGHLSNFPTGGENEYDVTAIAITGGIITGEYGLNQNIVGEMSSTTLTTVSGGQALSDHTVTGSISSAETGYVAVTGTIDIASGQPPANDPILTGNITSSETIPWTAVSAVNVDVYYKHPMSIDIPSQTERRILFTSTDIYSNANVVTKIRQVAGNDVEHHLQSSGIMIPKNRVITTLNVGESASITLSGIDSSNLYAAGQFGIVEHRCNQVVGVGTLLYPLSVGVETPFTMEQKSVGIIDDNLGKLKYQWHYYTTINGASASLPIPGAIGSSVYVLDGITTDTTFYCIVTGARNVYTGSSVSVLPVSALNGNTSPPLTALIPSIYTLY